jgi:hypothetical protein
MTTFEDGLWERLVEEHDADLVSLAAPCEHRNRRPVILGGSLTGLAAATAAAIIGIGAATSAAPAYAMTQNADGSMTITISELSTAIPELNAKFAQMGIDETVVPVTTDCTSSSPPLPTPGSPNATAGETLTFTPGRKLLPDGDTGVLSARQLSNGQVILNIGAMEPPVPSCFSATPAP